MRIALIGNYLPDQQQSMLRYAQLLQRGLTQAGHDVRLVLPERNLPWVGPHGARKWLGYVDKYILAAPELRSATRDVDLVHVCDHSNAVYIPGKSAVPYTATCHDLIAVRGALGEVPDCAASPSGKVLQRAILRGLGRARAVACVSGQTRRDVERLLPHLAGSLSTVPNALNFDYRPLDPRERCSAAGLLPDGVRPGNYLLMVGSAETRKNRETAIRTLAALRNDWDGTLLIAGEALSAGHRALSRDCGVDDRVIEVVRPDNERLRVLYSEAFAMIHPSRHEGFGWPLIEAQACGCPVVCSNSQPMPEITGGAALTCAADDFSAYAAHVLTLVRIPALRAELVQQGLCNTGKYSLQSMVTGLETMFLRVLGKVSK